MTTELGESKAEKSEIKRGERGKFIVPPVSPGRPPDTEEKKIVKRATKQLLKKYEQALGKELTSLSPILVAKAKGGNMQAFDQIHKIVGAYKKEGGNVVVPVQINFGEDRERFK